MFHCPTSKATVGTVLYVKRTRVSHIRGVFGSLGPLYIVGVAILYKPRNAGLPPYLLVPVRVLHIQYIVEKLIT